MPGMSLELWGQLCNLPGKSLAVAQVIWRLHRMGGGEAFPLSNFALDSYGISRHAKTHALAVLEREGLIKVDSGPYRSPLVSIVDENLWEGN